MLLASHGLAGLRLDRFLGAFSFPVVGQFDVNDSTCLKPDLCGNLCGERPERLVCGGMEPQVLEIEPVPVKVQRKYRIVAATLQAAFWTLGMFLWRYLDHRSGRHPSDWTVLALSCAFGGVIFGLATYFLPIQKLLGKENRPARVSIVVERDQVAVAYQSSESTSWVPRMVVRKGMVRSIFRIPGGIGVSERSQFGARMLGFLAIPNTLPKFNEVRALLESWQVGKSSTT
jgi:hypothetical protein